MKKHRFAFVGFRHSHIFSLWDRVAAHPDCEIVGAAESDADTRRQLDAAGKIRLTHGTLAELLANTGCNVVAIGDTYGRRGELALAALRAGCHVISDKPLCTRLDELDAITALAREKNLSVGCQLDLTETPVLRQLRGVIRRGVIGRVQTVTILAQHPLRHGTRASWYFEPGQHGGTINDIGIHVFDLLPWLTGSDWRRLLTAREWNAKAPAVPHFRDCAQLHGVLENGVTCFADLSYLAPDKACFELPQYWRVTVHGTTGMAEASYGAASLVVATDTDAAERDARDEAPDSARDCLQNFLDEIERRPAADPFEKLVTDNVLAASRRALETQRQAERANAADA